MPPPRSRPPCSTPPPTGTPRARSSPSSTPPSPDDPDAVRRALPAVLAIGHTSGADTVTGIRAALRSRVLSRPPSSHLSTEPTTECRMTTHVELRRGAYHDSVSLMQVSRAVAGTPGVAAAQVAMATELNVEVLARHGLRRARRGRPQRPRRRDPRPTTPPGWMPGSRRSPTRSPRCAAPATRAAGVTTRSPRAPSARPRPRSGATLARHLGARPARRHRGLRRHRLRAERDAVLRQRLRRGRGAAQGRRGRRRRARHGARLRHRARRRASPSASPTSCAPARSASSRPPAPVRSR